MCCNRIFSFFYLLHVYINAQTSQECFNKESVIAPWILKALNLIVQPHKFALPSQLPVSRFQSQVKIKLTTQKKTNYCGKTARRTCKNVNKWVERVDEFGLGGASLRLVHIPASTLCLNHRQEDSANEWLHGSQQAVPCTSLWSIIASIQQRKRHFLSISIAQRTRYLSDSFPCTDCRILPTLKA